MRRGMVAGVCAITSTPGQRSSMTNRHYANEASLVALTGGFVDVEAESASSVVPGRSACTASNASARAAVLFASCRRGEWK